jgi:uncharacterized protein
MRFIVLIILVVAAVWLIRRALRAPKQNVEQGPSVQDLIRCARCGMHLPRAEAREAGGRLFCGDEHARLGVGEG